jgi:DNA repair exonuclease SbcCD ATPase subunit
MGNLGNQINYNSPCLDVTVEQTEVNSGIRTNRTIKGKERLNFDYLKNCSEKDFIWLNTNMLVEAVKNYFTENKYGKDAIVINRIVNDLVRRIMSHAETIKEKVKRINAHKETIQAHGAELKKLSQEHTEQLEQLEQAHTDAQKQLRQTHTTELGRLEQAHTTELDRLRQEHESTLDKLRQEHASTKQKLTIKEKLVNKQAEIIQIERNSKTKLQKNLNELRPQTLPPTPPQSPTQPTQHTNNMEWGFGNGFGGGARRTKKRRSHRSNKTKLGRRLQNRISRRKTLRKRNKN